MNEDEKYMSRAIELAQRGLGNVSPNPMVGAVIVADGRIIGEGYHEKYGSWHAEVNAVNSVSDADKKLLSKATIYVNLEPCSHYGKTPPCANMLVEKGLKRVVVANLDPFPLVAGRGMKILEDAGIETKTGVLSEEGRRLNRRFFTLHEKHRPYIILKWAQSSDGYIGRYGDKAVISNENTQRISHELRASEMAIMAGWGTVMNDNPSLTVRFAKGENPISITVYRGNVKSLVDKIGELNILDESASTIIFAEEQKKITKFARCIKTDFSKNILSQIMYELWQMNISSLIVEGGAHIHQEFIDAGLWDEARIETNNNLTFGDGVKAANLLDAELKEVKNYGENKIEIFERVERINS